VTFNVLGPLVGSGGGGQDDGRHPEAASGLAGSAAWASLDSSPAARPQARSMNVIDLSIAISLCDQRVEDGLLHCLARR
jgi:hypothetical protein